MRICMYARVCVCMCVCAYVLFECVCMCIPGPHFSAQAMSDDYEYYAATQCGSGAVVFPAGAPAAAQTVTLV